MAPQGIRYWIHQCTPPLVMRGLRNLRERLRPVAPEVRANVKLKQRFADRERCFIIGNGPSLKKQNLLLLKGEITFACNFFNLHPQAAEIAPTFYCFGDANTFFAKSINDDLEIDRSEWFSDIVRKNPHAEFIVPYMAKEIIAKKGWFQSQPLWYVLQRGIATELNQASAELDRAIPNGMGTVAAIAIPAALFMGFKKIYLLGCDCNWFVQAMVKEDFAQECAHFYDRNPYIKRESTLTDFGMEIEFKCLSDHFKSLRLLRELAQTKGQEIWNATDGGLLDVFPRISFSSLLPHSPNYDAEKSARLARLT